MSLFSKQFLFTLFIRLALSNYDSSERRKISNGKGTSSCDDTKAKCAIGGILMGIIFLGCFLSVFLSFCLIYYSCKVHRERNQNQVGSPPRTAQQRNVLQTVPSTAAQQRNVLQTVPSTAAQQRNVLQTVPSTAAQQRNVLQTVPSTAAQQRSELQAMELTSLQLSVQQIILSLPSREFPVIPETQICTICLEELTEGERSTILPCGHWYHKSCIEEWIRTKGAKVTCPICNFKIIDGLCDSV